MRHIPGLYITYTEMGRAVFTAENVAKEDIIESCPIIKIPDEDTQKIHESILHDYYFIWPEGGYAIALGYGSLYNHSSKPNAEIIFDIEEEEIIISALREISPGEEILIDYTDGDRTHHLWFKEKGPDHLRSGPS